MKLLIRSMIGALAMLPGLAITQTNESADAYHVIAERNAFGLRPPELIAPPPMPEAEPREDLRLTGLVNVEGCRMALFTVIEPGKPNSSFDVCEGGQNDWLEVKSVNAKKRIIKARLKKPSVRLRDVGVDIQISLQEHGLIPAGTWAPGMR